MSNSDDLTIGIKKLFDSPLGVEVLRGLMDEYVYVENPTGDCFVEGQRALVLAIRETINYKEE